MRSTLDRQEFCYRPPARPVSRPQQRHFGITDVVVLLTVLIAVLAMILPAVYSALEQSKSVSCISNLKNISTWGGMYASENDYHLPPYESGWVAPLAERGGITVNQKAAPINDFACPSQLFLSPTSDVAPAAYWRGTNYGINQHLASDLARAGDIRYPEWSNVSIRSVGDTARKVLFADASGSNYFDVPGLDPTVAGLSRLGGTYVDAMLPNPARPLPSLRHQGNTANFLFADGHTETRDSFPMFMTGRGTGGFEFWHAEHWYPESGLAPPAPKESARDNDRR